MITWIKEHIKGLAISIGGTIIAFSLGAGVLLDTFDFFSNNSPVPLKNTVAGFGVQNDLKEVPTPVIKPTEAPSPTPDITKTYLETKVAETEREARIATGNVLTKEEGRLHMNAVIRDPNVPAEEKIKTAQDLRMANMIDHNDYEFYMQMIEKQCKELSAKALSEDGSLSINYKEDCE